MPLELCLPTSRSPCCQAVNSKLKGRAQKSQTALCTEPVALSTCWLMSVSSLPTLSTVDSMSLVSTPTGLEWIRLRPSLSTVFTSVCSCCNCAPVRSSYTSHTYCYNCSNIYAAHPTIDSSKLVYMVQWKAKKKKIRHSDNVISEAVSASSLQRKSRRCDPRHLKDLINLCQKIKDRFNKK